MWTIHEPPSRVTSISKLDVGPSLDEAVGVFGLGMLVWTVVLFDRVGEGALAIGSPVKLVVRGPFRHVRNPMMSGVFCIQLGTAIATASPWLFGWFLVFFTCVLIAIRGVEEPHLRSRFGADYEEYLAARSALDSATHRVGAEPNRAGQLIRK